MNVQDVHVKVFRIPKVFKELSELFLFIIIENFIIKNFSVYFYIVI